MALISEGPGVKRGCMIGFFSLSLIDVFVPILGGKKKHPKYSLVLSSLKKESREDRGPEMSNWMGIS